MITTMTVPYLMFQWLLLFMVTFVNFSSNIVTIRLNGKGDPVMIQQTAVKFPAVDRCLETLVWKKLVHIA